MRKKHLIMTSLLATTLTVPFCMSAHAQSDSSSLTGAVTDASGAFLPNAKVTIRNLGTGVENILTTNESGNFNAPNIPPGNYTVRVESTGFQSSTVNNVHVDAAIGRRVHRGDVADAKHSAGASMSALKSATPHPPSPSRQIRTQYRQRVLYSASLSRRSRSRTSS